METETKVIDRALAWELIDKLIEERGRDYKYQIPNEMGTCVYVDDGRPSCAVGKMVYYMVPLPETVEFLSKMDSDVIFNAFPDRVEDFEEFLGAEFTVEANRMFQIFQGQQDTQHEYGAIVDRLERDYPRV